MHHFPTKDVLIMCLIENLADEFCDTVEKFATLDPQAHGRNLRAYALAVGSQSTTQCSQWRAVDSAHSANAAHRSVWRRRFHHLMLTEEQLTTDIVNVKLIRLAIDGLWYVNLYSHHELTSEMRSQVVERIVGMTRL